MRGKLRRTRNLLVPCGQSVEVPQVHTVPHIASSAQITEPQRIHKEQEVPQIARKKFAGKILSPERRNFPLEIVPGGTPPPSCVHLPYETAM